MRLLVLFVCAMFAMAQDSAFQGRVNDPSGAPVPGAKITITNVDTGISVVRNSNELGLYTAPLLNPGVYRLACESQGFAVQTLEGIRLETGRQRASISI